MTSSKSIYLIQARHAQDQAAEDCKVHPTNLCAELFLENDFCLQFLFSIFLGMLMPLELNLDVLSLCICVVCNCVFVLFVFVLFVSPSPCFSYLKLTRLQVKNDRLQIESLIKGLVAIHIQNSTKLKKTRPE